MPNDPSQPFVPDQDAQRSTAVATRPTPARNPPQHLPPFRVLLHNDDVNTPEHVISSLLQLTPLNLQRAAEVTHEADTTGVALVLVTHKELAELYQEQLQSMSLTVTIEPAE